MTAAVTAVTGSVDALVNAAVVELSGDALLQVALRSGSPSRTLHYAMEAVATYSLAVEARAGLPDPETSQGSLTAKLNVARTVETRTRQYLQGKGTVAALVQYALAYSESTDTAAYLEQIKSSRQATGVTISQLVDLRQPPDLGHDVAVIATLSREVQGNAQKINMYEERARYFGGIFVEEYHEYLQLLKKADRQLNVILPLYAHVTEEEPTAAANVSAILGANRLEEFVQLQGQVSDILMKS
ncbi:hypothetical protein HYV83_04395 [Candidatus Woesearchaeota archaeon]|nr:hypothetical protein [Candidatus Woesearchaeota archaeon]